MADRFPDIPQRHIDYFFDHMIASIKFGIYRGELWAPHAIAIDSNNNQIYVTEGYTDHIARVSIFSETGGFINTFSHPHMKYPYGIAIHRDNVYVTDTIEHSVFHFKVEYFRLAARLGGRGSGVGQFDKPGQLAVSNNGDIFVSDWDNDRVQILDSDLHYQRQISHHSMRKPRDVKLTPEEVYILCETSPCFYVFSYTGHLIRSLVTRGDIGMQVKDPSFFCLDTDRNLLLSDRLDHQVKIFSKEGALIYTLGNGIGFGKVFYPQGIALTNNLKLVVVSKNIQHILQIFSFD